MLRSVLPRWRRVVLVAPCLSLVVGVLPSTALAQTEPAGEWIPPVGGPVVRPFVAPIAVYAAGHRGVDFAAAPGTPVRAANDGTVSFAGDVAGSLHVVVAHAGGIRTTYAFLLSADVRTGDAVRRGQVIGGAGGSGEAHEPSVLHFGVRVGDRYVDPMLLFPPAISPRSSASSRSASGRLPSIPTRATSGTSCRRGSRASSTAARSVGRPTGSPSARRWLWTPASICCRRRGSRVVPWQRSPTRRWR